MRYSVIAAKDGDTYHDEVFADSDEEAETKAREQLAVAWNMQSDLQKAKDEEDMSWFDAELDGFAVDPDPDPFEIIAKVFAEAKDAPTSFEPEQWLEGFEDGRKIIAERIALVLSSEQHIVGFDKVAFLKACNIVPDDDHEVECDNCDWTGFESDLNEIKDIGQRVAAGEVHPAGECPECGCLAHLVETDEELLEKADMKHNAQMLDGCETEDELNAELRAQTQGN